MKWIRTTERFPTEDDADWDGLVCLYSSMSGIARKVYPESVHAFTASSEGRPNIWWLEGYRTERPEPPKEDDE